MKTEVGFTANVTKPFNIASHALLMHMLAQQGDLDVGGCRISHPAIKAPVAV